MRDIFATIAIQIEKLLGVNNPPAHILCYHSVSKTDSLVNVQPSQFKKHIQYILSHFDVVALSEVVDFIDEKREAMKPIVAITFDDGYRNLLAIAPYLYSLGIKPTIFVTSQPNAINRQELDNYHPVMSMRDVKHLHDNYGWEIASHTATHPNLLTLNDHDLEVEVVQSKRQLEDELGCEVKYFAYPKGYYNERAVDMCRVAKYHGAFTTQRALISRQTSRYRIHRIGIDRTTTMNILPFMFTYSALLYFGAKQMTEHIIKECYDFALIMRHYARHAFVSRVRI